MKIAILPFHQIGKNLPASSAVYWFSGIYLGGKIALYQKLPGFISSELGRFFRRLADFSLVLPNPLGGSQGANIGKVSSTTKNLNSFSGVELS
ncbi:MAG: hypothetical protein QNJ63_01140 [Calothrix sp. MO_192.B10]|nr:hypothetical protein [Calothrix sp. MO_192.B10]